MWMCEMKPQYIVFFIFMTLGLSPEANAESGYVITTPRRWSSTSNAQVCVSLPTETFQAGNSLTAKLSEAVLVNATEISEKVLKFTDGGNNECVSLPVPKIEERFSTRVTLRLQGTIGSNEVDERVNITIVDIGESTFLQTDKYLYQPGQKVQFRVLSISGPLLTVSTRNYPEIYVESPVNTRIFQWLNVDNSKGLVHLSFDLSNEVDEGFYTIVVKAKNDYEVRQTFKVEDYVLPRYEVKITSPKYILGSDETVTLKLCAKYTFGEPVKGNATLSLAAGSWRTYANITQSKLITNGCENFTFDTKELLFDQNNCHIRIDTLKANAIVVEDGTNVELAGSNDALTVHRRAVQFTDETPSWVQKPYVPFSVKIKTFLPDNAPARNEIMQVCSFYQGEDNCQNFTTGEDGFLNFLMPSSEQFRERIEITAVKYPQIEKNWNDVMEKSIFYKYRYDNERYIDPTNSSLTIYEGAQLNCTTGQNITVNLPVIYYAGDVESADVYVEVQSRGQVQYLNKVKIDFVKTDLPFKDEDILFNLDPVPEDIVSGVFEVPMVLPPTVSPSINVLVWYNSDSGAVVADSREISISDCLSNKVDISWSSEKGEPGSETVLKLQGAKDSVCSVGVVDKSVELLSSQNDRLTISQVLATIYQSQVTRWDTNQLNLEYCLTKYNNSLDAAVLAISSTEEGVGSDSSSANKKSLSGIADFYVPVFRGSDFEALHMFDRAGFYVMSNLVLQKRFCDKLIIDEMKEAERRKQQEEERNRPPSFGIGLGGSTANKFSAGAAPAGGFVGPQSISADIATSVESAAFSPAAKEGAVEQKERNYLPETWLWQLTTLSPTGESSQRLNLPDTITEWVGRAVCVHPTEGVGISSAASITTFTPFFTDLTLPTSIKRGEILPLKVSVFNYLDEDLPVRLTLIPSDDYEFVSSEGSTEDGIRAMCITSKDKSVQTIKMKFKSLGDVNITVEAVTDPKTIKCGSGQPPARTDRLKRSLPVEAEGFLREKTWTQYVCSSDITDPNTPIDTWPIEASADIVRGSDRGWLTAIGDLMGPTLENIGYLVRMPSGCGEQNMINFAPNIYVMQYLEASNQTTDEIKQKITKFLLQGYQKQLTFRHKIDGSYSVFGEKDANGSTWLTAFVAKSFAQAKSYIFIDETMLNQSINLLKELQNRPNGCFESRGRVINKMLQGGISSSGNPEVLLSAYVLAAILEANSSPNSMESAVACIESDASTNPYSLALRAYSLALAKAPSSKTVIDQLLGAAVSNSSFMRWSFDGQDKNEALEVETAAYALLALLTDDPEKHSASARKIVRWLSSQRNGQGGFKSTQDTVVGLQALAAFEKVQPQGRLDMEVTLKVNQTNFKFQVTEDNKFLQQRQDLDDVPASVGLIVSGTGCTLVQGVLRYNVLVESPSNAFTLKIDATTATPSKCKFNRVNACTSYTLPDGASSMAILEFKLVSGYIPVKDDLKTVVGDGSGIFKRYEVDGSKVFFYLEEVTNNEVCAGFDVEQVVDIEQAKPGSVTVYDYYQPEYKTSGNYTFPASC